LLEALRQLPGELDWGLVIIGDGPLRQELEQQAGALGLSPRLRFLGTRHDVPELLRAVDLLALYSHKEGFANVILEALATGLPCVVSDVGGNAEAIEDGCCGYVIPPGEPGLLAERLAVLLADASLRERMGRAARERSLRFSLDTMVRETERLYLELATRRGVLDGG